MEFIADQANLYSVNPLFLFDTAGIGAPGSLDGGTRIAVGGGLQLTFVIAKFEVGYLRTVRRINGDSEENFLMRLVFQNLF